MAKPIGKTRELTTQECAAELGASVATIRQRIKTCDPNSAANRTALRCTGGPFNPCHLA